MATCNCLRSAMRRASRPFLRATLRDERTTDERSPMIAITTSSSMSVKPFEELRARPRDVCAREYIKNLLLSSLISLGSPVRRSRDVRRSSATEVDKCGNYENSNGNPDKDVLRLLS